MRKSKMSLIYFAVGISKFDLNIFQINPKSIRQLADEIHLHLNYQSVIGQLDACRQLC
jgi:hypothetical protein